MPCLTEMRCVNHNRLVNICEYYLKLTKIENGQRDLNRTTRRNYQTSVQYAVKPSLAYHGTN